MIQDRESSRRFFSEVWEKYKSDLPMQPLEEMVAGVILEHPEYQSLLKGGDSSLVEEFTPEQGITNPFLHMGMHIAIREQVQTNRPAGITDIYMKSIPSFETAHDLEHLIMDCLGETLWTAQRNNTLPDEAAYLDCVKRIL